MYYVYFCVERTECPSIVQKTAVYKITTLSFQTVSRQRSDLNISNQGTFAK